jgi:UDP-N-acetylglucosamine 2-epimerase
MKKKILTILGTRPELIKMFPIINKLDKKFDNKLVWSGQHYDYAMVKKNFNDLSRLHDKELCWSLKKSLLIKMILEKH